MTDDALSTPHIVCECGNPIPMNQVIRIGSDRMMSCDLCHRVTEWQVDDRPSGR